MQRTWHSLNKGISHAESVAFSKQKCLACRERGILYIKVFSIQGAWHSLNTSPTNGPWSGFLYYNLPSKEPHLSATRGRAM